MTLERAADVLYHLRNAEAALSRAHGVAGETEGDRINLVGPVRDLIYGLNTAVDALMAMIKEESDE